MNTSPAGKALIQSFETCRLKAYPDPKTGGAPWTCGWGSTTDVTPQTVWTQAQADANFERDIRDAEALVRRYVTHDMTQGQFDAFVSIFQNVGPGSPNRDGIGRLKSGNPSTLLRKFNEGDIGGAETQWALWVSPGSNVERGLRRRRQAELALFGGLEVHTPPASPAPAAPLAPAAPAPSGLAALLAFLLSLLKRKAP